MKVRIIKPWPGAKFYHVETMIYKNWTTAKSIETDQPIRFETGEDAKKWVDDGLIDELLIFWQGEVL